MRPWILSIVFVCIAGFAGSSCHTHKRTTVITSKPLPPGQAKKITGSQSAKPYAPGQRKKHRKN